MKLYKLPEENSLHSQKKKIVKTRRHWPKHVWASKPMLEKNKCFLECPGFLNWIQFTLCEVILNMTAQERNKRKIKIKSLTILIDAQHLYIIIKQCMISWSLCIQNINIIPENVKSTFLRKAQVSQRYRERPCLKKL